MHRAAPTEIRTAISNTLFFGYYLQVRVPDRHHILYPGELIFLNGCAIGFGVKPFEILGNVVGLLLQSLS